MQFHQYVNLREVRENQLPNNIKKQINEKLSDIGRQYWKSIPIKEMTEMLEKYNVSFAEPEYILTGRDGRTTFDLLYNGQPVANSVLVMTWYKMESGRWEVIAYLS